VIQPRVFLFVWEDAKKTLETTVEEETTAGEFTSN
jgi:hypothetical protein